MSIKISIGSVLILKSHQIKNNAPINIAEIMLPEYLFEYNSDHTKYEYCFLMNLEKFFSIMLSYFSTIVFLKFKHKYSTKVNFLDAYPMALREYFDDILLKNP